MSATINIYPIRKKMNDLSNEDLHGMRRMSRMRDLHLALAGIIRTVAGARNLETMLHEACRILVEDGPFHLAWVGLADDRATSIRPVASRGCDLHALDELAATRNAHLSDDHGPIAAAMRTNQPVICNDLGETGHMEAWRNLAVTSGIHSIACFPLQGSGQSGGTLNLYAEERQFFDSAAISIIEQITNEISIALHHLEREVRPARIGSSAAEWKEHALRYRQLVDLSPEPIVVCRDRQFTLANQAAVRMFGVRAASELIGKAVHEFIRADHRRAFDLHQSALRSDSNEVPFHEQIWLRADGSEFHAEVAATRLHFDGAPSTQLVVRDISARKRTERIQNGQNRILSMIAQGADLARILQDIALFMESLASRGFCSIMLLDADANRLCDGASPHLPAEYVRAVGSVPLDNSSGSCGTAALRAEPVIVADIAHDPLWKKLRDIALEQGLAACSSWPILSRDRSVLGTVSLYFSAIAHPTPQDIELFAICAELAAVAIESRQSSERIHRLAHYDGLTSLPNRFLFNEFLEQALRKAERHDRQFAVLFLDLDRFKEINDAYGHDAGDAVLQEIAHRLRSSLRQSDKIARMGGDEFYVLIEDLHDGADAADIAGKLLEEALRPIRFNGCECSLSASIGIAIYPQDGATKDVLLRHADHAMYEVKQEGKNGYRFFSQARPSVWCPKSHPGAAFPARPQ
jgi:diguanylate cyclase (GGDEF)-like protein/PAS domain S-box-containing protein